MSRSPGLRVIFHPQVFEPRCAVGSSGDRDIGVPFDLDQMARLGGRPDPWGQAGELVPGIWLSGEVPRVTGFETGDPHLRLGRPGAPSPVADPVRDDLSLAIALPERLVVIVGCAHAGIINILEHFRTITGIDRVHALIGGTHLGPVAEPQLRQTLAALEGYDISRIGLSHCTGLKVGAELCRLWPERAFLANVGLSIRF